MKKIEIAMTVICSDEIAEHLAKKAGRTTHISAYTLEYLRKNADVRTHIGNAVQLYCVDVSEAPNSLFKARMMQDSNGLVSEGGVIQHYLKGEAIKKAERLHGVIVKSE